MRDLCAPAQTVDADVTGPPVVALYSNPEHATGVCAWRCVRPDHDRRPHVRTLSAPQTDLAGAAPLGVAALWMIPCMALFGVQMNIANLIVIPLFVGMAIDNGIHLVDRALEPPRTASERNTQSTGKAVVLATLTTIAGFGSLMVAAMLVFSALAYS